MPHRILIVDPHREAADRLARTLVGRQHQAQLATDWQQALRQAAELRPSVVIVDTSLLTDCADAAALHRQLRALMDHNGLLIGATEYAQSHSARTPACEAQLDAHFFKPVPVLRFLQAIEN